MKCISHSCSLEQPIDSQYDIIDNIDKNDNNNDKDDANQGLLSTGAGVNDAIYAVSAFAVS